MILEFRKWGNSLAVRIPKPIADAINASDGKRALNSGVKRAAVCFRFRRQTPSALGYYLLEGLGVYPATNYARDLHAGEIAVHPYSKGVSPKFSISPLSPGVTVAAKRL